MKVALLGKGKTGGKVLEILQEQNIPHTVFDSKNIPTLEKLKGHDVIISFFSGEVFGEYVPLLIESRIPVVTGSTGYKWPAQFNEKLIANKCRWIHATNFSLGMNLVQQMIFIMAEAKKILSNYEFSLNEVHHTKKLDAPSGTALSWKEWTGHDFDITSERIGDVIGIHELKLKTKTEEITLKHEALDRKIFAEGALFAAYKIIKDKNFPEGLHLFQDIVKKELSL